jgi:predicted oxidoreductase
MADDADVIVVGGGLAGLVAATEIADAGKRVIVVDQEGEQSLGGQAFWSFGGLFLVDSPEQRRLGIKDNYDLALQDWMGTAGFDRDDDHWPRRWAEAYVAFAAGEKRDWLRAMGHRIFPVVGWAERGGYDAMGHGNSVPRFHVTWGTGPGIVEPFERRAREAATSGKLIFKFRHRVDGLSITDGAVDGVSGSILEPTNVARGQSSSRKIVGEFTLRAQAVIVASGGIGGNHDLVRQDLRRARTCRRKDDRNHGGGRRAADQPRPDVALCRRHQELVADLAAPRHSHPPGAVVDVVRRHGHAVARAAVSRLRYARPAHLHHEHGV